MKKIRVLVACGAGIATSTIVVKKVEDLFAKNQISIEIIQIKISEAANKQSEADMLISTTMFPTEYSIPAIKGMSFLTGIGVDKTEDEIISAAKVILNK